ncbi:hypothetical protein P7K49_024634 [Saguinus oedipus]|uniref:Uncharacterized protein n=1 Tax=Saguinus oedipus TaxID=9490 RepID=A0ABQ9UQ30_SAGOE|nr:hypothetical protein P7K49_024634 [Saguinus oedipus]
MPSSVLTGCEGLYCKDRGCLHGDSRALQKPHTQRHKEDERGSTRESALEETRLQPLACQGKQASTRQVGGNRFTARQDEQRPGRHGISENTPVTPITHAWRPLHLRVSSHQSQTFSTRMVPVPPATQSCGRDPRRARTRPGSTAVGQRPVLCLVWLQQTFQKDR